MNASKKASAPVLMSDLQRVDAHQVNASEYDELPELTDEMLARAAVNRSGWPKLACTEP